MTEPKPKAPVKIDYRAISKRLSAEIESLTSQLADKQSEIDSKTIRLERMEHEARQSAMLQRVRRQERDAAAKAQVKA